MIGWIIALLTWLAAPPDAVESVRPRAASCAMIALSTLVREPVSDEDQEVQLEQPGGGTPLAQPTKRAVKKCINGKCVITYE